MTKRLTYAAIIGSYLILSLSSLVILNSIAPSSLITQVTYGLMGLGILLTLMHLDYRFLTFSAWPWYVLIIFLLLITYILGSDIRGSSRWLQFAGINIQTSELVKPLMIIFLASFLTIKPSRTFKTILFILGMAGLPILLIFFQPDLGTALVITMLTLSMLVASGVGFKHLTYLLMAALIIIPLAVTSLKPYQQNRLSSFIDPNKDPLGTGYNAIQSTIAVGSGQLLGKGLGQGTQSHLRFLPERHTDFIFASFIEELGFVGGLVLLLSYFILCWGLLRAAKFADSDAGSLICLGTLTIIITQVLTNLGMNMGIMPITGLTLPLVSAGGSSMLSFAIALGLCLSVARQSNHKPRTLEIH
jgi:rod shape determining protein RodA